MKTMTVRDIRLKWPEAERALAREREIVVTRDGKPVARILPYEAPSGRDGNASTLRHSSGGLLDSGEGEREGPQRTSCSGGTGRASGG